MTQTYTIFLLGPLQPGSTPADVRQRLAAEFHIEDPLRLDELCSGTRQLFRVAENAEAAAILRRRVLRTGALCEIVPPPPPTVVSSRIWRKAGERLALLLVALAVLGTWNNWSGPANTRPGHTPKHPEAGKSKEVTGFRLRADDCAGELLDEISSTISFNADENQTVVHCKPLPNAPEQSVVVLVTPTDKEAGNTAQEHDLHVYLVLTASGKILSRYVQTAAYPADAIGLHDVSIDTARYRLSPSQRAFGIISYFSGTGNARAENYQQLMLLVQDGKSLVPVLQKLTVLSRHGQQGECSDSPGADMNGLDQREIRRTLSMSPSQNHGFANILVSEVSQGEIPVARDGHCIDQQEPENRQQFLLYFDGSSYVVPTPLTDSL